MTLDGYWAIEPRDIAARLGAGGEGLSSTAAASRLIEHGPNELREGQRLSRLDVLIRQLRSPLLLLLVFAAGISVVTGEWLDAATVLTIVIVTVGMGYSREYHAAAAAALGARVHAHARVLRDGCETTIPAREVVPGDVVLLSAGSLVPADAVILEATDFFVSEAALTGERSRRRSSVLRSRRC